MYNVTLMRVRGIIAVKKQEVLHNCLCACVCVCVCARIRGRVNACTFV